MKYLKVLLLCLVLVPVRAATSRGDDLKHCFVVFADKDGQAMNPYEYFDPKAIERRKRNNIELVTYSDLPVREDYIEQVRTLGFEIQMVSRWMNGIAFRAEEKDLEQLQLLDFVKEIWVRDDVEQGMVATVNNTTEFGWDKEERKELAKAQIDRMRGGEFAEAGIDGKGIRIAIFDIGFKSYKTNAALEHIISDSRVIKTWDFAHKKANVDGYHSHGTMVMSCIGGYDWVQGQPLGLAPHAQFLLAITERKTEFFQEEENWLAAAEWADKNGADIINSSLGYGEKRYFRYDMDGKTSLVSRAADSASMKGILVVNSAGNEGDIEWKNISTPGDAELVLTVGGIAPLKGYHIDFSSFGPTWDRRMKPNVCAYGDVSASGPGGFTNVQGTSFSSPLVAGFAACALQSDTSMSRDSLFSAIQHSADLFPYFDYAHGYGVPQASYFVREKIDTLVPQFKITDRLNSIVIELDSSDVKSPLTFGTYKTGYGNLVFYHIENSSGYLDKYYVVDPYGTITYRDWEYDATPSPLSIIKYYYKKPFTLRVYYKGTVLEYECKE